MAGTGSYLERGWATFTAGEALEAHRLVLLSAAKTASYCDAAGLAVAVTRNVVANAGKVACSLLNRSGSVLVEAAGAISVNALLYTAADGKVNDVAAGAPVGVALEAASGSGSIIEMMPLVIQTNGLPVEVTDPGDAGAIPVNGFQAFCLLVTAGAETRTLADPSYNGQIIDLSFKTDAGDCVVTTASPMNQTGNNTLTFADVGDHWRAIGFVDTTTDGAEWREIANDGVALTTV